MNAGEADQDVSNDTVDSDHSGDSDIENLSNVDDILQSFDRGK